MPNVNHQRSSRPAATLSRAHIAIFGRYLRVLSSVEQPPRLRAQDTFALSVDSTSLKMIPTVYPPLHIQPLTPAVLGRKANWGGETGVPTAGQTTPVLTATTINRRALFPRNTRFAREPSASWTPPRGFSRCTTPFYPWHVIPNNTACLCRTRETSRPEGHAYRSSRIGNLVFRTQQRCSGENSLPISGIKGQDNRGRPPTAILFFCSLCPCRYPVRTAHVHCH